MRQLILGLSLVTNNFLPNLITTPITNMIQSFLDQSQHHQLLIPDYSWYQYLLALVSSGIGINIFWYWYQYLLVLVSVSSGIGISIFWYWHQYLMVLVSVFSGICIRICQYWYQYLMVLVFSGIGISIGKQFLVPVSV